MKMKILITGSNGLLGQKLVYRLKNDSDVVCIATARGENRLKDQENYRYYSLDITNKNQINAVLSQELPDCIIHTAAMTNVDACELDEVACRKMNTDAVHDIICSLEKLKMQYPNYNPHFIHLSTDFIFNGEKGPLDEYEKPDPLSIYAHSKLDAENIVMQSKLRWAIVRTVLVYGITDNMSRSNIVLWAKSSLETGKEIKVVNDQFRTPTLAEDLADGCIRVAKKKVNGIYNISGKDFMSILELVQRVADYYQLNKTLIIPSSSADIRQPAKRPPKTGFIIEKARRELGYEPHSFEEGIKIMEDQINTMKQL